MSFRRTAITLLARSMPSLWQQRVHNPVFVIGCARSDTTLLSDLLKRHADIANWSELNDIWDPQGYPWPTSARTTPPIWIDPTAFTARWWQDTVGRQKEIRALFGAFQSVQGKLVFVNKTPLNTFRIPYLVEMFPAARFVHVVRDGRAVVHSYTVKQQIKMREFPQAYAERGLSDDFETLAVQLACFWKQNIDEVDRREQELSLTPSARLLEVTYEALCEDRDGVLATICDFLGIDPDRFHPALREVRMDNRNYKWREAFPSPLAAQITATMQPALGRKGYE